MVKLKLTNQQLVVLYTQFPAIQFCTIMPATQKDTVSTQQIHKETQSPSWVTRARRAVLISGYVVK